MTNKPIIKIELSDDRVFEIHTDYNILNPRIHNDTYGHMICFNNTYTLGDSHNYKSIKEFKKDKKAGDIDLPLYLLDHSGKSISTHKFQDSWDSGLVGYIRIYKLTKLENSWSDKEAKDTLEAEVKIYNQYMNDEVYGFIMVKNKTCKCCNHISSIEEDSCWGFYGSNWKDNGILDYLSKEDIKIVEDYIK